MQAKGPYLKRPCMCICTMGQQALDTVDFDSLHCPMQGYPVLYRCNILSHVCCHILITNVLEQTLSIQDTKLWRLFLVSKGYNGYILQGFKCFVQAATTYILTSGFKVSTVEQKGFNNSYMTCCCSQMQSSASLQQARNCRFPWHHNCFCQGADRCEYGCDRSMHCSVVPHEAS